MVTINAAKLSAPLFRECWVLDNLIPAPDMKSGWSAAAAASPAGYGSGCYTITLTGTASTLEVCTNTTASIPLVNTHIYYARVYGKQSAACGSVGFYWPIAEPSLRDGIPVQAAGAWRLYSIVNGRTGFSNGRYQFRLDFNNNRAVGSMTFSSPMLLDLTAAFGAGGEPTQEWCDANIPYFAGTYILPVTAAASVSAAGFAAKELREPSIQNLIRDGSFEGSVWSGTTYDTAQHLYGTRSSRLSGNSGTVLNSQSMIKPVVGHIYYGRHSIKTDGNAAPADCRFEWFAGDGEGLNFVFGYNRGNHPDWYTESARIQVAAVNGTSYICRNFVVQSNCNVWCDGLMIVDLTQTFGAGKEPDKRWCDEHIVFDESGGLTLAGVTRISAAGVDAPLLEEV